jgi:hypothetical protein
VLQYRSAELPCKVACQARTAANLPTKTSSSSKLKRTSPPETLPSPRITDPGGVHAAAGQSNRRWSCWWATNTKVNKTAFFRFDQAFLTIDLLEPGFDQPVKVSTRDYMRSQIFREFCGGDFEILAPHGSKAPGFSKAAVLNPKPGFLALLDLGFLPQPPVAMRQQQGVPNQTPQKLCMNDLKLT